ncbi:PulJ/GspJ family protein [Mucilaginibacter sp.]|uniref:PulJ/GspJ family protein n=1 Tax=Mucilaginibacter sp. TaxID=1882438 RepID=UPI003D1393F4
MKSKVKAFTLLEMTITMLLTAIVIAITYTALTLISGNYQVFNKKNSELALLADLDHVLKRDFEKADSLRTDTGGISLQHDSSHVIYVFSPDFIVRKSLKNDTFKVQTRQVITSFEKEPQNMEHSFRIDALDFIVLFDKQEIPYHCEKTYSSENLINQPINAGN